jgi:hypothetical protein
MQYKGMNLIKIIEPQIFDPPKRMLVWNANDREPCIDTIYAIGPSSMLSPVRAISDDGRLGTHCYECCADIPKAEVDAALNELRKKYELAIATIKEYKNDIANLNEKLYEAEHETNHCNMA